MNMKMIPSKSFDESCQEADSWRSTSIAHKPAFLIPYWTIMLVLVIIWLGATIFRTVCA